MKNTRWLVVAAGGMLLMTTPGATQPTARGPRQEAVAETRLLMEGLNQSNFRGLEKLLAKEPAKVDAWVFARGQALIIAETGNLLMLRPPHNAGESAWQDRSADLRVTATRLARLVAARDYAKSKAALHDLAQSCNRCHQSFQVAARIRPFAEGNEEE